ncbi:hypothetical protein MNBD_ACTINO02-2473, partial [hydrothermal vent metagenome]
MCRWGGIEIADREQRIQEARRRAKANSGKRAEERAAAEESLRDRIANMTPDQAGALASRINFD